MAERLHNLTLAGDSKSFKRYTKNLRMTGACDRQIAEK